jgi:hypothetical protein
MLWGGPYTAIADYPAKGFRFTISYNSSTTGTSYIQELGVWNRNYIKGSNLYAFLYDNATFQNVIASGVTVSGSSVVTKNQTGILVGKNESGILVGKNESGIFVGKNETGIFQNTFVAYSGTGAFYPRNGNPSGYLTGSTGGFVDINQTGIYSNSFYPLTSNPSGYLTAASTGNLQNSFVSYAETGAFYPRSGNPSGFLTGSTGGFVSLTESRNVTFNGSVAFTSTALFGSNIVVTGQTQLNSGVTISGQSVVTGYTNMFVQTGQTGIFSNSFYPLNSNPAGYITGATGGFVSTSQTGILVGKNETGILVGKNETGIFANTFYPISSNPSSFLSGVGVASFISKFSTTSRLASSIIVESGGKIGIGITTPSAGLDVMVDNGFGNTELRITNPTNFNSWSLSSRTGAIQIVEVGVAARMQITNGGNVGFGTSTPNYHLDVTGAGNFANGVYDNDVRLVNVNQTGTLLVGKNQTGIYSGSFYPLNSNPSGYVTASQVGYSVTGGQVSGSISGWNLVSNKYGFGGGIYTFSKGINSGSSSNIFAVANSGGAQIMDVMVSCSAINFSAAKSYAVAHAYGAAPISQTKISTTVSGAQDFTSNFFLTGVSGMAMRINNNGTVSGNFLVTLILGGSLTSVSLTEF